MDTSVTKNKFEFNNSVLNFSNKSFYYLESFSTLKIDTLNKYDAIILDARDVEFARIILKKFRSHSNIEFYLKPIFLINTNSSNLSVIFITIN